jgi:cyclophilin family peptidyl-prolyl cis-trans isomerase
MRVSRTTVSPYAEQHPPELTGLCKSGPVRLNHRATGSLLLSAVLLVAGCGQIPEIRRDPVPVQSTAKAKAAGECEYVPSGEAAKPVKPPPTTGVPTSGSVRYVLQMTEGRVIITMDRAKAPCTVNSFVSLASQGYFDKTKCHRLADSGIFILQCGDPTGTGRGGPGYQFANETDGTESYTRGVVAMANAGPGTNGSQFFLVWDDSTSLDEQPNYTIFATMDPAGRDVVATMAAEGQDGSNPDGTGRPNNPSEIIHVSPA